MGKSGVSGKSSRSWKITPNTFEDIDKYVQGTIMANKRGDTAQEGGAEEETLVEKMKQNSHVLYSLSFLVFISFLCSSVGTAVALWLCALQVLAIFASSIMWEEDQVLAKGGKFRPLRLLCQFLIVGICGTVTALLFWVAGAGPDV